MPSSTVSYSKTLAVIDEEHCIGCTLCIKACPFDAIIGASKQLHTVINAFCTGCKLCIEPCPVDCISMQENTVLKHIQPEPPNFSAHNNCSHCEQCIPACPKNLKPVYLYEHIRHHRFSQAEEESLSECAQCAECSRACPQHIPLAETFFYANKVLQYKQQKKIFTQRTKQRLKVREQRLSNLKSEQLASLSSNKTNLADKLQALKKSALNK